MESLMIQLHICYEWIVRTTCQASALICLVLLVQWALKYRLNVRVRYVLWLVVLMRLAMPWMPQSRLSLYNLLPDSLSQVRYLALASPPHSAMANDIAGAAIVQDTAHSIDKTPGTNIPLQKKPRTPHAHVAQTWILLPLIWLSGVCFLSLYILVRHGRVRRMVRLARPVTDPRILDLLANCQRRMGVQLSVHVVATDSIGSPALFGLSKPSLLLPTQTLNEMNDNELRYIFMHELAHLKHHDNHVSMIASLLHVLHWFNPLIGYAFKQMHVDRELACDGRVLSLLHPKEAAAYGDTIISQIELHLASNSRPVLAMGFAGDQAQIKQRIAMISLFQKEAYRWSPLALGLIGCLAVIGLTNGCKSDQAATTLAQSIDPAIEVESPVSSGFTETPAGPHLYTHTKRIHIRHMETGKYLVSNGGNVQCNADKPGEAGLWEAHYTGEFTPDGDMMIFSVPSGRYLSTSDQGHLTVDQRISNPRTRWIRQAGPLGVKVISKSYEHGYLRLDEQGQIQAVQMGRDHRAYWDIVQLD